MPVKGLFTLNVTDFEQLHVNCASEVLDLLYVRSYF